MNPLTEVHDEFTALFESLGYKVSWDFNKGSGTSWYEIMDDRGLVCQIDMGVPLADIVEDLVSLSNGGEMISKSDYTISGPAGKRFDKMCEKVRNKQSTT